MTASVFLCGRPSTQPRRGLSKDGPSPSVTSPAHFLPASLTFSPACFRLPLACSALPLPSSTGSPRALPVPFLTLPLAAWALSFALFVALTAVPFSRRTSADFATARAKPFITSSSPAGVRAGQAPHEAAPQSGKATSPGHGRDPDADRPHLRVP